MTFLTILKFNCLNIFLPLLADPSSQINISIAQLIASAVCSEAHRNAVIEWMPPAERSRDIKGRRGWEKTELVNFNSPARQGGWVIRLLINFLKKKDMKVNSSFTTRSKSHASQLQEAALGAVSSLAIENTLVATTLARAWPDVGKPDPQSQIKTKFNVPASVDTPLNIVLNLMKSRTTDVQLAASLW
jgi:hypothetical protein